MGYGSRSVVGERYLDAAVIERDFAVSPLAIPEFGLRWYEAIRPSDAWRRLRAPTGSSPELHRQRLLLYNTA